MVIAIADCGGGRGGVRILLAILLVGETNFFSVR